MPPQDIPAVDPNVVPAQPVTTPPPAMPQEPVVTPPVETPEPQAPVELTPDAGTGVPPAVPSAV